MQTAIFISHVKGLNGLAHPFERCLISKQNAHSKNKDKFALLQRSIVAPTKNHVTQRTLVLESKHQRLPLKEPTLTASAHSQAMLQSVAA